MPRYYCDYCDTYLTHDSPSVRKQHNAGYKHKANVRTYYQQYEAQLNQSLIDQKVKEHLGAFRPPVPAPYQLRPGMPMMPMQMPMPGAQFPGGVPPGIRPPMLPRPMPGAPGYMGQPMPQMAPPPGAPLPGPPNGLQRPPQMVPGSAGMPTSSGGPPMFTPPTSSGGPQMFAPPTSSGGPPMFAPPMFQGNAPVSMSGGGSEGPDLNAQAPEANH